MAENANQESAQDWKALEQLIADIQKDFAPGAKVTHNATLFGHDTETTRQIDVLVEQQIGQFPMRIIVECKDYARPVDAPVLEAFVGVINDVRANQGCMVSAKGFTKSARNLAKKHQVSIYTPIDTAHHKWRTKAGLALPVLCEFRSAAIAFGIKVSAPVPMKFVNDLFFTHVVKDTEGNPLGTCTDVAIAKWNNGEFPFEVGDHEGIPIFPTQPYVDNGYGMQIPVELTASLSVKGRRYFGMLGIDRIRGLRDEQTGEVVTNAFQTASLSPVEVENQWTKLGEGEDPPRPPAIHIQGLECWEVQDKKMPRQTGRP